MWSVKAARKEGDPEGEIKRGWQRSSCPEREGHSRKQQREAKRSNQAEQEGRGLQDPWGNDEQTLCLLLG